ncbi:MAG: spore coat protein CotH [Salibacteraceae bacterium]|jgi:spore coat protein CotH
MIKKNTLTIALNIVFLMALSGFGYAQIDGDAVFKNDQIIQIELTFHQISFFDSLEANYITGEYMKADLLLTDSTGSYTYLNVGIRLKGNSTYNHPNDKKAFKIDFNEYVSGQKHDGLKKLNFSNNFKDPSMMREKVFFDVCADAGVQVPRSNFANVYFNGTLWGLYTVVEQIDDQFLDWSILDDDGNLFKAGDNFGTSNTPADLIYYGSIASDFTDRYELKTNEDVDDWTDLISLLDFINNSSGFDFTENLHSKMELTEYLRSVALDNMFSNLDSYTGSARNYYVYHNMTTDKWEWIKWDGNESFGSYSAGGGPAGGTNNLNLDPDYHDTDRPLLENIFASSGLYNEYLMEYCDIMGEHFNSSYIDPIIDGHKALIQSSVYADNKKMYTNAEFDTNIDSDISSGGGPGGGNIYGLKSFIQSRVSYLEGVVDCSLFTSVHENDWSNQIEIYPNPANSEVVLSWGNKDVLRVTVFNTIGIEKYSNYQTSNSLLTIDVSDWTNGMYVVQIVGVDGSFSTGVLSVTK